eukprot:scaffold86193_cov54-Phaeocystis_antarctica.AAC.2
MTRGRLIRPGAKIAASHARNSRHAGAKNVSSASAVSARLGCHEHSEAGEHADDRGGEGEAEAVERALERRVQGVEGQQRSDGAALCGGPLPKRRLRVVGLDRLAGEERRQAAAVLRAGGRLAQRASQARHDQRRGRAEQEHEEHPVADHRHRRAPDVCLTVVETGRAGSLVLWLPPPLWLS